MKQSNWIFFNAYKKYADFKGRATRKEYWLFQIFFMVISKPVNIAGSFPSESKLLVFDESMLLIENIFLLYVILLLMLFYLGSLIPAIAVSVRRLHDIGISGWCLLIPLPLFFFGNIYLLILVGIVWIIVCSLKSQEGENDYGPNPFDELERTKGEDNA